MNKVLLVGRLTRDPELRTLPSGNRHHVQPRNERVPRRERR